MRPRRLLLVLVLCIAAQCGHASSSWLQRMMGEEVERQASTIPLNPPLSPVVGAVFAQDKDMHGVDGNMNFGSTPEELPTDRAAVAAVAARHRLEEQQAAKAAAREQLAAEATDVLRFAVKPPGAKGDKKKKKGKKGKKEETEDPAEARRRAKIARMTKTPNLAMTTQAINLQAKTGKRDSDEQGGDSDTGMDRKGQVVEERIFRRNNWEKQQAVMENALRRIRVKEAEAVGQITRIQEKIRLNEQKNKD